jgi:hypothetical protein
MPYTVRGTRNTLGRGKRGQFDRGVKIYVNPGYIYITIFAVFWLSVHPHADGRTTLPTTTLNT